MNQFSDFDVVQSSQGNDGVRLEVCGELNVNTSPKLRQAIAASCTTGVRKLDIVLERVPRIDSSGIATLIEGLKWSRRTGGSLTLSGVQQAVREMIVLSKLDQEFDMGSGQ